MKSLPGVLAVCLTLAAAHPSGAQTLGSIGGIDLVATVQCTGIVLTWTVSPGVNVQEYTVYAGTSPTSLAQIASTKLTSYTFTRATPGAAYYFGVVGELVGGGSISSNPATARVPVQLISLAGTAISSTAVQLTWTFVSSCPVRFYRVFQDGTEVAETEKFAYTDRGLTPGATYYFKVRGGGVNSNGVSVTLPGPRVH
jgi:fibronectin type 3 domain-containing protein